MQRRSLLKLGAALPLTLSAPARLAARVMSPFARVRPQDPYWPRGAQWQELKTAGGGNLLEPHSLFAPCAAEAGGGACSEERENLRNPFWIGDQPGGTQVSGWLDAWTPAASAYAVRARHALDVAQAVNFARTHNLRLVVKGGAHSYLGTSNAPDSLLIWTRALNEVRLHDDFVGEGCSGKVAPQPAVSLGAGCMWADAYAAVTTRAGRYVQGGGCTTAGVCGLVPGAGFGRFSKGFGTAAAGLLEAEVVTADGQVRVVNACRDPDLLWALKGGGGGTFGVVTRLTLRTHALPATFGAVIGTISAASDEAYRALVEELLRFYRDSLLNPHWGEQIRFRSQRRVELSMVFQGLSQAEAQATWKPFLDWVMARPDDYALSRLQYLSLPARVFWNNAILKDLPGVVKLDDRAQTTPYPFKVEG